MRGRTCCTAAAALAVLAGCGSPDDAPVPAGPNQAAADRQAGLDKDVRQSEQDYQDAMRNFEDVVLTVPGDGQYVIVETAMQGEMWPGRWETGTPGPVGACIWTLLSSTGELLDNGIVEQGETGSVTITEVGSVFHSSGCADWRRADGS